MKVGRGNGCEKPYIDARLKSCTIILDYLDLTDKIYEIYDTKGCLEVYWKSEPTVLEMEQVDKMWIDKNEFYLEHFSCSFKSIKKVLC